jgi:hypothetical protein
MAADVSQSTGWCCQSIPPGERRRWVCPGRGLYATSVLQLLTCLTAVAQGHVTRAPWAGIFPGLAIFIAVLGFNLLSDALRHVLEPRLRGVSPTARLLSRG